MDQNIELCTKTVVCCAMHDDMYEAPLRLAEMQLQFWRSFLKFYWACVKLGNVVSPKIV